MIEREVKLLLDANAVKQVQVHYAIMSDGYMVVIDLANPWKQESVKPANSGHSI